MEEIYFDNAATSFPKPEAVLRRLDDFHRSLGASAGRGAYPRAVATGRVLQECREELARLIHAEDPKRIIFTLNASDGLNFAVKGLPWKRGDRALISPYEHNSVLRPMHALKARLGVAIDLMPVDAEGRVIVEKLNTVLRPKTRLICCLHASNVTGVIQPIKAVGEFARSKGILFLVDAAQSVGAVPVDVRASRVDFLAFPGHKALLGPLGTGGLYIRPGLDLIPLREGGTGSASEKEVQPDFLPDRFESGSHNAFGISGWLEAVKFIRRKGVENIRRHEVGLLRHFFEGLDRIPAVRRFGPVKPESRAAVVSLVIDGQKPLETAQRLWKDAKLMVRAGLHCAPWAHRAIGTFPLGTARFSFGPFTTHQHIDRALSALKKLA
ncbi:MAG: aminotransferase class V-fold PLP-dependent enzyme [Elusimicrobia bacterium]|nr:aminotransferase class V-fold PLP-dependent enzyme [Elusimicrobiota bacterium]